jgi:hypothetical protein
MKRVAIVQSNYLPWKGYFDLIAEVDEFILYDDMQFTRRDWRNRNQIKTPQGLQWLTVPVQVKGKFLQTIRETLIDGTAWAGQHLKTLTANYARAPFFEEVFALLAPILLGEHTHLSVLNRDLLEVVCRYLGLPTTLRSSWDYRLIEGKSERLAQLCADAGASEYLSGPSARGYLDEQVFTARGIAVRWFDYEGYPEYPQLWGAFVHPVSVVDLLFNCGPDARRFLKSGRG